jgi:hypothetical protein
MSSLSVEGASCLTVQLFLFDLTHCFAMEAMRFAVVQSLLVQLTTDYVEGAAC